MLMSECRRKLITSVMTGKASSTFLTLGQLIYCSQKIWSNYVTFHNSFDVIQTNHYSNTTKYYFKLKITPIYWSSCLQMFFKIGVLKNFANFSQKYLCWSLFLIKLKRDSDEVAFCEICKNFKSIFYHRIPLVAASWYETNFFSKTTYNLLFCSIIIFWY